MAGSPIVLAVALDGRTVLHVDAMGNHVATVPLADRLRIAEALSFAATVFLQGQVPPADLAVAADGAMLLAEYADPAGVAPSVGRLAQAIADVASTARAHSPARLSS